MFYYDMGFLPVYVGYCPDEKSWNKEMKRLGVDDEPYPDTDGRCTSLWNQDKGTTVVIVCINSREGITETQVIGLIAHEVVHAVDFIMEDIGEKQPSKEFKAYLSQYLTQSIYNDWKKIESKES